MSSNEQPKGQNAGQNVAQPPAGRLVRALQRTGDPVVAAGRVLGDLLALAVSTWAGVLRGERRPGEVARQMYAIGNRSLFFVMVTMGFFGMVFIYQGALQLDRIAGDVSLLGREFIKLLCKDVGPSFTTIMISTRVGAGIAAEIGSMNVTEQIDALRMSGVRPIDYLVAPRFLASAIMTVILSVIGTAMAYAGGGLTAWAYFELNPQAYFDLSQVTFAHVALGLSKAAIYGVNIPIIAAFYGLRAYGGSEGVGQATTSAVIGCSFAVLIWDMALSLLLQLLGVRL
ncbi:MAG TPA: ABC transporter permease [Haliangium sp.]|nr:ABC transporter permease [Haliangium sp.]